MENHSKSEEEDLEKKNWRPLAKEYDPIKISSINGIGTFAHDRAAIRAIESKYSPGNEVPDQEKLQRTIIVAKLPLLVGEKEVERLFSKYGKILSVKVVRDLVTKRSKQYGFVEYEKERHFLRACNDSKGIFLGEDKLLVDKAVSRSMPGFKPRRLGGGFGGTLYGGQIRFGCKARPWLRPKFKSERRLHRD